ncbi:CCCH zinc finger DNA binding protein [Pyrenophora tritici-repentis]|uniref:C-x8-C-x5-C-x3-H type zinc finger protein n=2 Tax=Pyrenophora tritici-repentis TaxID=45151 RepID=A0A2W1HEN9_9PLEO|nr:C-x8-C-x5-C-x3-H type zinc finger protein [Pyrenophora tritici-repentis]KAF7452301.1 C-x8-C-x5-C-x3-H type zinc finger protein [Pyrenophora tritici-repentis]KAG9386639.1 C-x8-C-x5-C-x3-H type zinc finger protein [Pyrenophora tritici-repentis]KAI0590877.1 C-x8-C-x5-C-x3-H type zinc finger protein [Pyrenophora tritici-repentis]KAI0613972.1 C-x8-C-x5-C-x3-H type zinc finger protein [Pyrenophora tritici-repentis]
MKATATTRNPKYERDAGSGDTIISNDHRYEEILVRYKDLESKIGGGIVQDSTSPDLDTRQYVVVIVDGHSHQFHPKYLYGAESGGSQAAKILKEATVKYLEQHHPHIKSRQVHARIYANIKGLSNNVAEARNNSNKKLKLPPYPRALGAFAAGFSRTEAFFYYVDVVEHEDVVMKVTALFSPYIRDPLCAHVFLAASGSEKYARLVDEHSQFTHRFTMITSGGLQQSHTYSDKECATFADVFEQHGSSRTHTEVAINAVKTQKKPSKVTSGLKATSPIPRPPNSIPINTDGNRVDHYMDPPTNFQWSIYQARISKDKLCTPFYLGARCENRLTCTYDHKPITPTMKYCHRYAMRKAPCQKGGTCRTGGCVMGHTCRDIACKNGRVRRCRMPPQMHDIDLEVAKLVKPGEYNGGM